MSMDPSAQALGDRLARPWIDLYQDEVPATLSQSLPSPLTAFDRCVKENPDAVAVWYFDSPLTYRQLNHWVGRLQSYWSAYVGKGARVAIMNQNTPATLVALIAAWRLGAIVIPLSPMLTQFELLHYLQDGEPVAAAVGFAQARALVQAAKSWGRPLDVIVSTVHDYLLDSDRPQLLQALALEPCLDLECPRFEALPAPFDPLPAASPSASDIAFLTYTSGTTGKPKAACNTHGNVCFSAEVFKVWLQLDRHDVLLAAAPFSHITGLVAHIAAAWMAGAAMVMAYRFDAQTMLSLIDRHGCTSTVAAITAYIALLDHPTFEPAKLKRFRKLFSGGAPVSADLVNRWEAATGVYIHNAYGLTESTSATHLVPFGQRAPIDPSSGVLSVGVPVPSTDCRISEPETSEEASGVPSIGELQMRGPQVATGYWRNPQETSQSFREGWLKTGDLGRMDESGWCYIIDRAKDVIVASGFKVWPREVELTLESHPAVKEAAVIGIPDSYRGETPKAFVVLRARGGSSEELLFAHCRERLAPYKVPRSIEFVEALPRNHAGKLLRRQLRAGIG